MKFSQKAIVALISVVAMFASSLSATAATPRQTREEYIERYKAIAVAHMERYGIPASITMAQGILESDSGNSRLSKESNNHFGIKCKKTWKGERVFHDDDAKGECFRAYPSVEASYLDHAEFLDSSPRYDSLFAYPATDYRSWARGLKAAGYATAPDYAERLVKIIENYRLYLLDQEDGAKIYTSRKSAEANTESWFAGQSTATGEELVNPDAFRVTINSHRGYNIYRTNHTCYVVAKEGDTYSSLGAAFHISERMLRKFNDASRLGNLAKGDIVYIERKKAQWEGNAMWHTVRRNETLHTLAQSYGIRERSLAKLNRLGGGEFKHGQTIKLR
ncbi:MAG: glucosaminidase domain-containing protein [Alistipes sp.]|nr:glucosaminidase domain-containing protein [Alistipes sp.]